MRPFFKWFGSKYRLSAKLPEPIAGAPIIEAFAGSAAYSVMYGADCQVLLAEANQELRALWDWLIGGDLSALEQVDCEAIRYRSGRSNSPISVYKSREFSSFSPVKEVQTLIKLWSFTQPRLCKIRTPNFGGWWCRDVIDRVISQQPQIRDWRTYADYRHLPDIYGTWIIDPPYQHNKYNHVYGKFKPIDYKELADWVRSRRGLVIVHEAEPADWLPFQPFADLKFANTWKKSCTSKELIHINNTGESK
jgi:site-specific DNA-adenine methylase